MSFATQGRTAQHLQTLQDWPRDATIRRARNGEEDVILELLAELAEYEKLLDKFHITRTSSAATISASSRY